MNGWLVVNSFLDTNKYTDLYTFLNSSAERHGVHLDVKKTTDLICPVGNDFSGFSKPDFVLFWDKDIHLARRLELSGIRVFNTANAVEICDNKALTAICLAENGIRMPKTILSPKTFEKIGYSDRLFLERAAEILGFPMIIKEAFGSFGQQVYLADDFAAAQKIVDSLGHKDFLMQEFITTSFGKDVRINVVGGRVIASMLRYSVTGDFRSNISSGGKMKPYEPSEVQKELAVQACEAIGLDFSGVDVLFGEDDQPILCEVNSNPHFVSTYECTGIDISDHILQYVLRCL